MTLQRNNVVVIGIVRRDRLIDNPINRSYSSRLESTFGIVVEVTILQHHYKVSKHDFLSSTRDQNIEWKKCDDALCFGCHGPN
jgi:hypothetical protein